MVTDVGKTAGKTFAPKTKEDVVAHIAKADAKFPTTSFPSFKDALLVEKDGKLSLIGIDKKIILRAFSALTLQMVLVPLNKPAVLYLK